MVNSGALRLIQMPQGVASVPSERRFSSRPEALRAVRNYIREAAGASSFQGETQDDLVLAVSEACANVARHSGSDQVVIRFQTTKNGDAEIFIVDAGVFLPHRERQKEDLPGDGLGLPLIRALTDEVEIHQGTPQAPGTVVKLIKRKPGKTG
jgi:anti-sigma regulatory factor (Ser/Thr protein kinase)